MKNIETDIVIIGAGVAGCVAALALSDRFSVTLIDIDTIPPPKVAESLPPAAERLLEQLGLEHFLDHPTYLVNQGMNAYWGTNHAERLNQTNTQTIKGWHVCRQGFEMALRQHARQRGVNCFWPYALDSSRHQQDGWHVVLHQLNCAAPARLACKSKIVIDASGRLSTFAQQQGVIREKLDHLVTSWITFSSEVEDDFSSIHPVHNGWWYSAPIPQLPFMPEHDQARVYRGLPRLLAYHTDNDLLPTDYALSFEAMLAAGSEIPELKHIIDSIEPQTVVHHGVTCANSSRLSLQYGQGWYAVGDAAMSFDPLGTEGMFNAMASAMKLSELISKFGIESQVATTTITCEYQQQLERLWQQLARSNQNFYAQERRWLDHLFWERRAA